MEVKWFMHYNEATSKRPEDWVAYTMVIPGHYRKKEPQIFHFDLFKMIKQVCHHG